MFVLYDLSEYETVAEGAGIPNVKRQIFPIETYHICNARPVYITVNSCVVTWISVLCVSLNWGKKSRTCFRGKDAEFCGT